MKIIEIRERDSDLIEELVDIWYRSVKATHLFLSEDEISRIKQYVPEAIKEVAHLLAAYGDDASPIAFIGVAGKIEMLFVAPEERGKGTGKALLDAALGLYPVDEVSVNEQNPQAIGFYEHMGFMAYKRTETDEEGNPYPLLYMRRRSAQGI